MMYRMPEPRPTSIFEAIVRQVHETEIGRSGIGTFRALVDLLNAPIPPEEWARLERALVEKLALASGSERKLRFAPGCRSELKRGLEFIRAQRPTTSIESDEVKECA